MTGTERGGAGQGPNVRTSAVALHVGRRIRLRRMQLGFATEDLSRMVHVSKAALGAFEDGTAPLDIATLYGLAVALEVPLAWFYDGFATRGSTPAQEPEHSLGLGVSGEAIAELGENARLALLTVYFRQLSAADQSRLVGMARAWAALNTR